MATYARELFEGTPPLDTVYVPVGMGSGINALIAVRDLLGLPTEIVGVVSELAPATALSFAAGSVVATERADTFVDGCACRQPDPEAMTGMCAGAARIIAVPEVAVADAMRLLFAACHHLPEPAGAIALAGLRSEHHDPGARVAIVLSGANLDTSMAAAVLSGATPAV